MKTRIITSLLTAFFLFTCIIPAYSQRAEQQYQKGLMQEESEGNLPEAINIFNSIVENQNAEKSIQAKALLHVGLCYEKMGKQEATKAYQKLVNNFPSQKNEVAIAKERLSKLILAEQANVQTSSVMTNKKIWEDFDVDNCGQISPNGKYFSYTDWNTGDLAVYEIETGKKRNLTKIGQGNDYEQYVYTSKWTPDGKKLYYSYFASPQSFEIRSIELNNLKSQTICKFEEQNIWLNIRDVSSDGNTILATIQSDNNTTEIILISVANGEKQIIKEFSFTDVEHLCFTADESAIIYDYPSDRKSANRDIYILSLGEKTEIPLIQSPANDFVLGLCRQNKELLFASSRSGSLGFWLVKLENDKIKGEPKFIKTSEYENLTSMGFTNYGAFAYCYYPSKTDVYEIEINPYNFEIVMPPYEKAGYFIGSNSAPAYSPNGKYLAYVSRRLPFNDRQTSRPIGDHVCIKSLENDSTWEIKPGISNFGFLQWTPDNRSIIVVDWDVDQKMGLYKIDVMSGNKSLILKGENGSIDNHQVCPNGNLIVVKSSKDEGNLDLIEHSLDTGDERILHTASWKELYNISCSPDGKWIAFIGRDKIRSINIIPSEGGVTRSIYKIDQNDNTAVLFCWSADSKSIYLPMLNEPKKDLWDICRIPVDGSTAKKLGLGLTYIWQLSAHPDGKHLAYSNQGTSYKMPEVWMMENFLPSETPENPAPPQLTNKKIWDESSTDLEGAVSPDGKYLSFVDWDTGDLAFYEIATGKKRRLTNKSSWDKSSAYCEYSRWFPNSKMIIYLWFNDEQFAELRTISLDNPEPQILIKDKDMEWAEIYDCSSDGKYVLACLDRKSDKGILTIISTNDGSERALQSSYASNAAFSYDQRFVMYDLPQENNKDNKDIYILDLNTEKESKLIEHPADDRFLGRIPNWNDILFVSDRTGTPDFWRVKLQNGKSISEADLVKSNRGPFAPVSLGFTNNGAFYYGQQINNINVYETEIEPITGKIITAPEKIIQSYIGTNGCSEYSPDGKYLAYVSRRPPGTMRFTSNPVGNVLCIRSLETKEEKEIRPNINVFGWPQWSPDGNSVMVVNFNINGHTGFYQIDTRTGIPKPFLISNGRDLFGGHGWLPDGNTFFYGLRDSITKEYQLILQNIKTGKKQVLYKSRNQFDISASRDGMFLSLLSDNDKSMKILPVSGGETKELFKSEEVKNSEFDNRGSSTTWSSDGKYIYFAMRNSDNENSEWELCRVSLDSHKIDKLGLKTNSHFANLNAHPDGKHFSYSLRDKLNSEVWMMENFLPESEPVQMKEPEGIVIKQLPDILREVEYGSPSPDANFFSYMDGESGNMAIRNFNTEKTKILTTEGTWDGPLQFANFSKISPDNKWAAYSWCYQQNRIATYDLRVLEINNPSPRILYKMKEGEVHPAFWLSDNKRLIAYKINTQNNTYQIISVNSEDGSYNVLNSFKKINGIPGLCLSSDERYIAFDFLNDANKNFDIYSIPVEGGPEVPLVEHPANDRTLGWLPGRKELLFLSDRSGTWDIWSLPVLKGKPNGQPRLIYSDAGEIKSVETTRDGTLYFSKFGRKFTITISPFDSGEGKINMESGIPLLGSNYNAEWSPDGQSLAYNKEIMETVGYANKLYIYDFNTGKERPVAENLEVQLPVSWSPKENSILIIGLDNRKIIDKNYAGGIYNVDVITGKETELLSFTKDSFNDLRQALNMAVEWSLDVKSFFYLKENRIVQFDLETGQQNTFYTAQNSLKFLKRFSKGNDLVFMDGKQIMKASGKNGDIKSLCSLEDSQRIGSIYWSPDGNYIYLYADSWLCKLPSDGGTIQKVCPLEEGTRFVSIHPEGKKIAVTNYDQKTGGLVMENLAQEIEKVYSRNE